MPEARRYGPQSDRVSQATAMISAQAGCDLADAFDLLRERAFTMGQSLEITALDVIDGVIHFDDSADSD
jgi:AmiR/NasT family two-component response regulator